MKPERLIYNAYMKILQDRDAGSAIVEDLGLNIYGRFRLALTIEAELSRAGYRHLTDKEIRNWRTMGDIIATINEIRGDV